MIEFIKRIELPVLRPQSPLFSDLSHLAVFFDLRRFINEDPNKQTYYMSCYSAKFLVFENGVYLSKPKPLP